MYSVKNEFNPTSEVQNIGNGAFQNALFANIPLQTGCLQTVITIAYEQCVLVENGGVYPFCRECKAFFNLFICSLHLDTNIELRTVAERMINNPGIQD